MFVHSSKRVRDGPTMSRAEAEAQAAAITAVERLRTAEDAFLAADVDASGTVDAKELEGLLCAMVAPLLRVRINPRRRF